MRVPLSGFPNIHVFIKKDVSLNIFYRKVKIIRPLVPIEITVLKGYARDKIANNVCRAEAPTIIISKIGCNNSRDAFYPISFRQMFYMLLLQGNVNVKHSLSLLSPEYQAYRE